MTRTGTANACASLDEAANLQLVILVCCFIQGIALPLLRSLHSSDALHKDMYWNDKYEKGEDVSGRSLRFLSFGNLKLIYVNFYI